MRSYEPSTDQLAPHAVSAVAILVVFLVMTLLFTVLRFHSRWTSARQFFATDWVLLAAEVVYIIYTVISFVSLLKGGVGHHVEQLGPGRIQLILKLLIVIQITYAVCMALLKVSICLLYVRIFPQRWIKICSYGIILLSASWALYTILLGLLICRPIAALWEPKSGTCGDENAGYSSVSAVELVIDVFIILLPLPVVWRLNMTTVSKIATTSLFCLGLITIVVTGVRLHTILNLNFADFSYTAVELYNLTVVELGVAVMVTCGMGLRPLVEKLLAARHWRSWHSSGKATNASDGKEEDYSMATVLTARSHPADFETLPDTTAGEEKAHLTQSQSSSAKVSAGSRLHVDHDATAGQAITVSREFVVERENV
ncbi:hypothetical protein QQS21_012821 [Conoideocrella luteorostrata]|uniref:Rhodopsin domain-containing protein n=1 Tax=Conoideocrella luteorostrata TaxID=1105319 RepID=A0AAJ0FUG8_9HYPO|nr:hypothetical protein QQS21_012821 [Conoideocrella luteorostrata]